MTGNGYYVNRLKICIGKKSPLLVKLFLADLSHLGPLCGGLRRAELLDIPLVFDAFSSTSKLLQIDTTRPNNLRLLTLG